MVSHARKHASAVIFMRNKNSFESVVMSTLVDHKKTFRELRKYVEW